MVTEHVAVKIDGGVFVDSDPLIRIGIIRQSELAAIGKCLRNIAAYLGIVIGTDGGGSVFIVIFIIRRLYVGRPRVALGLRVVGRQACGSGVFARAIPGIVTIQLFGIPVVGVFYISRLT